MLRPAAAKAFSGRFYAIPWCPRRGFPPLSIQPIDFVALYQQHLEAEQAQAAAPPAEAWTPGRHAPRLSASAVRDRLLPRQLAGTPPLGPSAARGFCPGRGAFGRSNLEAFITITE